ncbi:unnamed protein product [Phaeothamnion confervicola]
MKADIAATVPRLRYKACDLESITLEWDTVPGMNYKLEFRGIDQPTWMTARSLDVQSVPVRIEDLEPSASYLFRLSAIKDGTLIGPGPEVAFDTEVVSCAPKSSSCCAIT